MPSLENSDFSIEEWATELTNSLQTYSNKIESCIASAEWEILALVLQSRHAYIQRLFSQRLPDECLGILKQNAEDILQQDKQFQSRVEAEKRIVAQQRVAIENRKRAVQAYNNH